jgi:sugar lactone lactonase YvrE
LCPAQTYTIQTFAGGVNADFYSGTGDGGPANQAGLANPVYDVDVDSAGNVYIVAGTLIRKVAAVGNTISTFAGGGAELGEYVSATQAALAPTAIALDSNGNLYIADTAYGNSRIRKIDATGVITTVAGGAPCCALGDGGPATSAYIGVPYGVAVDAAGNIYIAQADSQNSRIRKVAPGGDITTVAGGGTAAGDGGQATAASLARPTGVAVDAAGNLYIAEANGNRVRKVSGAGIITTVAGNGSSASSGDGGQAAQAGLNSPWHVAVDPMGSLLSRKSLTLGCES